MSDPKHQINTDNTWIIVPAFNEEKIIKSSLFKLNKHFKNIILVDDASIDQTHQIANQFNIHILHHPINLGQGAALQTGFTYVLKQNPKYIITFDADDQMDPEDAIRMVGIADKTDCDVILGTRFHKDISNSIPPIRKCLLRMAILFTRITTGLNVSDTHNGLRLFRKEALKKIKLRFNRMAHASDILYQINSNKFKYIECPNKVIYSTYSMTKGQKTSDIFNLLWDLFFR